MTTTCHIFECFTVQFSRSMCLNSRDLQTFRQKKYDIEYSVTGLILVIMLFGVLFGV